VWLTVLRLGDDGRYTPLAAARRTLPRVVRNLEMVPPEPRNVLLHTGDRVRIEAVADHDGYLTVFNIGPTGDLTLLYPDPAKATGPTMVPANQPVRITEAKATPPAGSERVCAVWSHEPLRTALTEVARRVAPELPISPSYRATRNLTLVKQSLLDLPPATWRVVVVELDHCPLLEEHL
jgi:hypothetical protein